MKISETVDKAIESHFETKNLVKTSVKEVLIKILEDVVDKKSFSLPNGGRVIDVQEVEDLIRDLKK